MSGKWMPVCAVKGGLNERAHWEPSLGSKARASSEYVINDSSSGENHYVLAWEAVVNLIQKGTS